MASLDITKLVSSDLTAPEFLVGQNAQGKVWLTNSEDQEKEVEYKPFLVNKKPLVVKFSGSLSTNGVNVSKFGDTENISIGVQLDQQVLDGFYELEETIEKFLKEKKLNDKFEVTTPVKEDRIYIKLRYDLKNKKWIFKTNVSINHSKPQDANLFKGQGVTVICSVSAYVSLKSMKVGIYVTPVNLNFSK